MRALRVVAAVLCVLLMLIPTVVLVRAATAPSFRWTGPDGECPVVEGSGGTRCLSAVQVGSLAMLVVGSALGLAGTLRGGRRLALAGAAVLAVGMLATLAYRAASGRFVPDDVLAALPALVVAGALWLAARFTASPSPTLPR